MSLLEKVIYAYIDAGWAACREEALIGMKRWIDAASLYAFARDNDVLVDGSAEEFAIEFMTAYNDEVAGGTY